MKINLGIIGVIILAVIVLIIASLTYAYVESIRIKPDNEITDYLEGNVKKILETDIIEYNDEEYPLFEVTLLNNSNITNIYEMFFYQLYPPLENMDFRFYYEEISVNTSQIHRIVRVVII